MINLAKIQEDGTTSLTTPPCEALLGATAGRFALEIIGVLSRSRDISTAIRSGDRRHGAAVSGCIGQALIDQTARILLHVKDTELLLEVDE